MYVTDDAIVDEFRLLCYLSSQHGCGGTFYQCQGSLCI